MEQETQDIILSSKTLTDLVRQRAAAHGEKNLYTFLLDGEDEEIKLSYAELDQKARALAATLQEAKMEGERALLLYPPSLDYITAFFGCLYAKVVAVPAYPPDPNRLSRTLPRLLSIIRDSEAKVVLTTESIKGMAEFLFQEAPELRDLKWIATDELSISAMSAFKEVPVSSEDLAFLQYTSGSTSIPKGVMLSHENLLSNLELIKICFDHHSESRGVIWLPPYHDMGLIGGILQPLYAGFPVTLISPLDFLQKPMRWLKAISKYKATTSGGPNFAYDLCIRKVTLDSLQSLDLSSWSLAFTGAEPIQLETVRKFTDIFAPCGFKEEAFYPCYGLAEATLIVSGGKKAEKIRSKRLDKKALENHQVKEDRNSSLEMVGCGTNLKGQQIEIVHPESLESLKLSQVGEIWVSGKSVAQGYWKKDEESKNAFQAYTKDGKGPFLRTGDFGFLSDGELYVTGRMKDMMIFSGANHYPQDIELSIEKLNLPLRAGCGAAFSISENGTEKLAIVWEVDEKNISDQSPDEIYNKMREAIAKNHELHLHAISLVKKGSVPKTSSGKIQRQFTKNAFLESTLDTFSAWHEKHRVPDAKFTEAVNTSSILKPHLNQADFYRTIEKWLVERLASKLQIPETEVDLQRPFQSFGLDSKEAVGLSGELENLLGKKVSPTLLWQYPNIESLAKHLSNEGAFYASGTYS